ncbi:hypothetical protein ACFL08_03485 [Patescibacteria group bacterium]
MFTKTHAVLLVIVIVILVYLGYQEIAPWLEQLQEVCRFPKN